jgi:nucleotide-binding universal stress UspA family protein
MKRILVPTDFSSCANNAVDFAVQSAKYLPAEINILHAFEVKGNMYTDYLGVNREFTQSLLVDAETKLAQLKKQIEEKEGITVKTHLSLNQLTKAILDLTSEEKIDLVVMGTLGASGLREKLWGSNTASLVGKSKVPVLAIPYYYTWKKPEKVLLATNHFEKDPVILDFLFETADLFMAEMQVIVFTEEEGDQAFSILEHTRKTPLYEKMLQEQYSHETVRAIHLFGNEFEESLQEYIKLNQVDVLAMITYPRNFMERIFHPSMTKRMAYHTKIPLLAIPARTE